jgi:hypothetical protein
MCRLIDAYVDIAGQHVPRTTMHSSNLTNVASSRFLRPYNGKLARLDGFRAPNHTRDAVRRHNRRHLSSWWLTNFGIDLDANMALTRSSISRQLASELGM